MNNPSENTLKNAIGEYLVSEGDYELRPMIGHFVLFAEITDPDTGESGFMRLRSDKLPLWTESGVLGLRFEEIKYEWIYNRMIDPYMEEEE